MMRVHREIPGYCDVYCQLCGFGPRSSLVKHITQSHDIDCKEYKRLFGRDSLLSEDLRFNLRLMWEDRQDDGVQMPFTKRRNAVCRNGHRVVGRNVLLHKQYRTGEPRAECRQCAKDAEARRRAEREPPPWKRRKKCRWCGESFVPRHPTQRSCSRECNQAVQNAKASKRLPRSRLE